MCLLNSMSFWAACWHLPLLWDHVGQELGHTFAFAFGMEGAFPAPFYLHPKEITARDNQKKNLKSDNSIHQENHKNDLLLFVVTMKEVVGDESWQISGNIYNLPPPWVTPAGFNSKSWFPEADGKWDCASHGWCWRTAKASQEHSTSPGCWGDKTKGVSSIWSVIMKSFGTAKVPTHTKMHQNKQHRNILYIIQNSHGMEKKIDMSWAMFFHMYKEYIPFPCAGVMNLSGFTFFLLLFLILKGHWALKESVL